jgi:hypothetical protein
MAMNNRGIRCGMIFGWSAATRDLMGDECHSGQVFVSDSRRLVYVSGAPGSRKTSLAAPLATEVGYTLLSKDRIKETLHDALGAPEPDQARRLPVGGARARDRPSWYRAAWRRAMGGCAGWATGS